MRRRRRRLRRRVRSAACAVAERTIDLTVRPCLDAMTVRPGDTLVARVKDPATLEYAEFAKKRLAELLPGVTVVFLAAEQLLVYRPDGGDDE